MEKITREGRKYGISLWIASQLIENDAKSRLKAITDQCSMKVYFMAGTEHSKKIANLLGISSSEKMRMLTMMRSLKKQEYVFQLNGKTPHKCIANEVKSLE